MESRSDSLRRAQPLLGTFVEIAAADAAMSATDAAIEAAFQAVVKVHRLMSFHEADSDVSRLNNEASARAVTVDAWTFQVLEMAVDLHRRSNGMFDVAAAPALQNLGLLSRRSEPPSISMGAPAVEAIELLSRRRIRFRRPGISVDLGGIAKGFAVDRAVGVLRDHGIPRGLVNAGGDLAAFGPDSHAVYVRDPRDPRRLMCRIEMTNEALASTGGRFDPLRSSDAVGSTIIDPRTQQPTHAISGATVRAPSCAVADALTKVVMIIGEHAGPLLKHYNASALFVLPRSGVRITSDWHDDVHLAA